LHRGGGCVLFWPVLATAGNSFRAFGLPHLAAVALTAGLAVGLVVWARKAGSDRLARWIGRTLAVAMVANELIYQAYGLSIVPLAEFARQFLPLHVCGVAIFLTAWTLWRPNRYVYEIAYFWALGGSVQALLTPSLAEGGAFPSYWFFAFFSGHALTVAGVVFATWGLRMRPGRGAVLRVVVVTNVYLLAVAGVNWLLGANYMFLCQPPEGMSPFFFLPWPWYIILLELVGLALVLLLCLPFVVSDRLGGRRLPPADRAEAL